MKKLNNRGFSLIELLVALAILALIVSPLLHSFVTSATTAGKATTLGNATLAGKNLGELTESYDLNQLYPRSGISSYGGSNVQYIVASGLTDNKPDSKVQQLWLTGVNGGGENFNARITFDPTTTEYTVQNQEAISIYTSMDAVLAQSKDEMTDPDALMHNEFITNYVLADHPEWDKNAYDVKRTITLKVITNGDKIEATVDYGYDFTYTYDYDPGSGITELRTVTVPTISQSYMLFPQGYNYNVGGVTSYPNIYLMYYPMKDCNRIRTTMDEDGNVVEETVAVDVKEENIKIINEENLPFTLFLVKQAGGGAIVEADHSTTIIQHQGNAIGAKAATIYSNAKESLENPLNVNPLPNVKYYVHYGNYVRALASFAGEELAATDYGALVKKEVRDRIYKVTIEVFESSIAYDPAATPIYTLETMKLQ